MKPNPTIQSFSTIRLYDRFGRTVSVWVGRRLLRREREFHSFILIYKKIYEAGDVDIDKRVFHEPLFPCSEAYLSNPGTHSLESFLLLSAAVRREGVGAIFIFERMKLSQRKQ